MDNKDLKYMMHALDLAQKGEGWVNPNPLVGAVIVKNDRIIGEGYHMRYGDLHAERNALKNAIEDTSGATMYVTLEPCCHYGKTPPCVNAIIEHKIKKVFVGIIDPNPLVSGSGISKLREAGIEVVTGLLEEELSSQNKIFISYMLRNRPWVIMKTAMSLDGKIATHSGDSRWVTSEDSRQRVQEMRSKYTGIMVGIGTAITDDPLLNCRIIGEYRQPIRIIVDSNARLNIESKLVQSAKDYRTIVAHTSKACSSRLEALSSSNIELICCESNTDNSKINLEDMLIKLKKLGIDSILLEGGGELNGAFISKALVDEVYTFIAPKIVGGKNAKTPVEGDGFTFMADAINLSNVKVEQIGTDILIQGDIKDVYRNN